VDYPSGKETDGQPIIAVVDVKKTLVYSDTFNRWEPAQPGEAQGGAYNADPLSAHQGWRSIALPSIYKSDEVISTIAVRNNSNCNKIQLRINIYDETGAKQTIFSSLWLGPKQLRLVDLANVGTVAAGFFGAGTVEIIGEEQLCDVGGDGHVDPEPVMPSAIVFNKGHTSGDLTTVYDGIPYSYAYSPCSITISGHVVDQLTLDPINDASISIDGAEYATTDSTGYYSFEYFKTAEPITITVAALATGYSSGTVTLEDIVCDDQVANFELYPECDDIWVNGTVTDKETGLPIAEALVTADNVVSSGADTTDEDGGYEIELAFADIATSVTVTATGYISETTSLFIPRCITATVDFELHQAPSSRILLYYGNGGLDPDDGTASDDPDEYYDLKSRYENAGYIVEYTDAWPSDPDLEEYRLIVLILPGYDNDDVASNGFNTSQAAQLGLYIHGGGRLVLLVDNEAQAGDLSDAYNVPNDLMASLSIGITVTNNASGDDTYNQVDLSGEAPYDNEFTSMHLEGDDCQELSLFAGAFDAYESDPNDHFPVIAADKVGFPANDPDEDTSTGWDVIVVSDAEILSDFFQGPGWPENLAFADNLIAYPTGP
jgi:hypothetical protein